MFQVKRDVATTRSLLRKQQSPTYTDGIKNATVLRCPCNGGGTLLREHDEGLVLIAEKIEIRLTSH